MPKEREGLGPVSEIDPELDAMVGRVADLLPAQGPLSVFIHHNPLHAFEDRPFEEAILLASRLFQCEPWLAEAAYRAELAHGRITEADLEAVIESELGTRAEDPLAGTVVRRDLYRSVLLYGIPEASGAMRAWLESETSVLERFRDDLPVATRQKLLAGAQPDGTEEAARVRELWCSAIGIAERTPRNAEASRPVLLRPRDLVLAARSVDLDDWSHPLLIRFTSAYLDQGLGHWTMPGRERGLYACFAELYAQPLARLSAPWAPELVRLVCDDRACERGATSSLRRSLEALEVEHEEWEALLLAEARAMPGWAGICSQLEARPDRVPAHPLPIRLLDYLAVRLLVVRAALGYAAEKFGVARSVPALRALIQERARNQDREDTADRAWLLFHAASLLGFAPETLDDLSSAEATRLDTEVRALDSNTRRRLFHLAYERRLRHHFYDALLQHTPEPAPDKPCFQALFCIDEREESLRRHLEEVEPRVETFGTAGFFGVAMYFRGATDAHPRPLCPVAIQPRHYVGEKVPEERGFLAVWRQTQKRLSALLAKNIHLGSRTFGRGAVIMAFLGTLTAIPLVLRVLFPWSRRGLSHLRSALVAQAPTRLELERSTAKPPLGEHAGFSVGEMTEIVESVLRPLGIRGRFAPLVFVIGHGSTSLNNPQESAHDCGACGGGHGGPNARAFAQMANDPRVRAALAARGLAIPEGTWFIGAERNTATNDLVFFDADLAPEALAALFQRATRSLEAARIREAHERCRRFESAPLTLSPDAALYHVQSRATDLAQPRPEYGHATNALAVVGRRACTQGLFFDRRVFLLSYDPAADPDGALLSAQLKAVTPVIAGINLEYFFGYVDGTGYGSGTKLPHNVTSLLGVMDGAQSDLRVGLPWQMLEVHEPVRLTLAVEAEPAILRRILHEQPYLERLVRGRWLFLACLDPKERRLLEFRGADFEPVTRERLLESVTGPSLVHYGGKREHLPFVRLQATEAHDA